MGREEEEMEEVNIVYKTKVVQFLGRSVPIILQNDNGPCPLLAICNVLLLRNNVSISLDMPEISLRELLSLVAERLLDANSNVENKDDEYVNNQQQNISDAIQLLPRLATGIDVNVRFRHIHDFEFTPECALFDLFDIGLVHGWLCDPQDEETSQVIAANSYNTLVEKLVALQASKAELAADTAEEPTVDFAAATTAALGVPTPSASQLWSSETSFEELTNELNQAASNQAAIERRRRGDDEEAAELLQALHLSQSQFPNGTALLSPEEDGLSREDDGDLETQLPGYGTFTPLSEVSMSSVGDPLNQLEVIEMPFQVANLGTLEGAGLYESDLNTMGSVSSVPQGGIYLPKAGPEELGVPTLRLWLGDEKSVVEDGLVSTLQETTTPSTAHEGGFNGSSDTKASTSIFTLGDEVNRAVNPLDVSEEESSESQREGMTEILEFSPEHPEEGATPPGSVNSQRNDKQTGLQSVFQVDGTSEFGTGKTEEGPSSINDRCLGGEQTGYPIGDNRTQDFANGSHGSSRSLGSSGLESEEPLYEGEDDLANQGGSNYGDTEPLYEGEAILAEQAMGSGRSSSGQLIDYGVGPAMQISTAADEEGKTIESFLNGNASQLTYYGLFSLQEGLKERELCVFFRNNHFSTMFKFKGSLYLLATDQGYLNQPDLVWEKLNTVDGDSVFTTGNFLVFKADQQNSSWNEQDAVAATADYMSSHTMKGADQGGHANYNSDLQLAMALQQQELEHQQQQQSRPASNSPSPASTQAGSRPTSALGPGRMITGPARASAPKPETTKAKEKCTIM